MSCPYLLDFPFKGGRRIEKDNTEHNKIETNSINLGGTVRHEHREDASHGGVNEELRVQVPLSNPSCPYIISAKEEVDDQGRDPDGSGNALFLQSYSYGRTGNRFSIVSNTLRLGFCCKSTIVSAAREPRVYCSLAFLLATNHRRRRKAAGNLGTEACLVAWPHESQASIHCDSLYTRLFRLSPRLPVNSFWNIFTSTRIAYNIVFGI